MFQETTTELSPTRYFWLQLASLGAGLGAMFVAHHVTRQLDDPAAGTPFATMVAILVTTATLGVVARAVYVIVTSAFSDAYRVFRSRHLMACTTMLFAIAVVEAGVVFWRGPFDTLVAYGRITPGDLVDAASVVAAVVCMVGAGVASIGAWDRMHEERNWHRTLHLYSRRRI